MTRRTLGVMAGCAGSIYTIYGVGGLLPNYSSTMVLSLCFILNLTFGPMTHALPFSRKGIYLSRIGAIVAFVAGSLLLWVAGAAYAVLFLGKAFPTGALKLELWCAFFFGLAWIGPGLCFLWSAPSRSVGFTPRLALQLVLQTVLMFLPWDRLSTSFARLAQPIKLAGAAGMVIACGLFIAAGLRLASRRDF